MPPVPEVAGWHELAGASVVVGDDERALLAETVTLRGQLEREDALLSDEGVEAYLNGVLQLLLPAGLPDAAPAVTVAVIRSARVTALGTAGGGIFLTTSLLAALENEAQLAAILGHELGHVMARHAIVAKRFGERSRSTVERMRLARRQEEDADRFALATMRRARYDARELPRALALTDTGDDRSSEDREAFRSHPFTSARVRDMTRATRGDPTEGVRVGARRYEEALAALFAVAAEIELRAGALDRATTSIARYRRLRPTSGRGFYLEGEHARLTEPAGRRSARARAAYERAVELDPTDPKALRRLGFLSHELGDEARAAALLARYLTLAPNAPDRALVERVLRGAEERRP